MKIKLTNKVNIQTSYFNSMMLECISNQLLPFSTLYNWNEKKKQRELIEFYGIGYLKERITLKIINSFELCNPHFLTVLRSSMLKRKSEIFDLLQLDRYINTNNRRINKEYVITVLFGECGIQKHNNQFTDEQKRCVEEIEQFIVNLMFIHSCNIIFDSPMKLIVKKSSKKLHYIQKKKEGNNSDNNSMNDVDFDYSIDSLFKYFNFEMNNLY